MTENQTLKLYLLQQNAGDLAKAKEAYEFIMGDDIVKVNNAHHCADALSTVTKDGVYLRYKDGHEEWFDGTNDKYDVVGITVRLGERRTCIAKFDAEDHDEGDTEFPLLASSDNDTEDDRETFIGKYYDAYNDFNGKVHTESLIRRGCKIPLADNQYIPSAGEWLLVMLFIKKVQEALEYACGEPLKEDWYWSSTEVSSNYAWYVYVSNGNIYWYNGKTSSYRVRPCLSCEAI